MTRQEWQAIEDKVSVRVSELYAKGDYTVPDRLEQLAASQPNVLALVYGERHYGYAQLHAAANRFAGLAVHYGLKRGDVASLMIENRPQFLFAWLGLMSVGVIPALVNTEANRVKNLRQLRAGVGLVDTCCYIFTSGTTGLPKAAHISHGKFLSADS